MNNDFVLTEEFLEETEKIKERFWSNVALEYLQSKTSEELEKLNEMFVVVEGKIESRQVLLESGEYNKFSLMLEENSPEGIEDLFEKAAWEKEAERQEKEAEEDGPEKKKGLGARLGGFLKSIPSKLAKLPSNTVKLAKNLAKGVAAGKLEVGGSILNREEQIAALDKEYEEAMEIAAKNVTKEFNVKDILQKIRTGDEYKDKKGNAWPGAFGAGPNDPGFQQGLTDLEAVYRGIVAATELKPDEKDYIHPKIANELIEVLWNFQKYAQDRLTKGFVAESFEDLENINKLLLVEALIELQEAEGDPLTPEELEAKKKAGEPFVSPLGQDPVPPEMGTTKEKKKGIIARWKDVRKKNKEIEAKRAAGLLPPKSEFIKGQESRLLPALLTLGGGAAVLLRNFVDPDVYWNVYSRAAADAADGVPKEEITDNVGAALDDVINSSHNLKFAANPKGMLYTMTDWSKQLNAADVPGMDKMPSLVGSKPGGLLGGWLDTFTGGAANKAEVLGQVFQHDEGPKALELASKWLEENPTKKLGHIFNDTGNSAFVEYLKENGTDSMAKAYEKFPAGKAAGSLWAVRGKMDAGFIGKVAATMSDIMATDAMETVAAISGSPAAAVVRTGRKISVGLGLGGLLGWLAVVPAVGAGAIMMARYYGKEKSQNALLQKLGDIMEKVPMPAEPPGETIVEPPEPPVGPVGPGEDDDEDEGEGVVGPPGVDESPCEFAKEKLGPYKRGDIVEYEVVRGEFAGKKLQGVIVHMPGEGNIDSFEKQCEEHPHHVQVQLVAIRGKKKWVGAMSAVRLEGPGGKLYKQPTNDEQKEAMDAKGIEYQFRFEKLEEGGGGEYARQLAAWSRAVLGGWDGRGSSKKFRKREEPYAPPGGEELEGPIALGPNDPATDDLKAAGLDEKQFARLKTWIEKRQAAGRKLNRKALSRWMTSGKNAIAKGKDNKALRIAIAKALINMGAMKESFLRTLKTKTLIELFFINNGTAEHLLEACNALCGETKQALEESAKPDNRKLHVDADRLKEIAFGRARFF